MQGLEISCEKVRTDHKLLWTESSRKWRVTAVNKSQGTLYVSWAENFANPFTHELWIKSIDETQDAVNRFIAELDGGVCASFVTTGDRDRAIAPDRFVQIAVLQAQKASWIMERVKKEHWGGFNVYTESLVGTIRDSREIPVATLNVMPRISGWWWS